MVASYLQALACDTSTRACSNNHGAARGVFPFSEPNAVVRRECRFSCGPNHDISCVIRGGPDALFGALSKKLVDCSAVTTLG